MYISRNIVILLVAFQFRLGTNREWGFGVPKNKMLIHIYCLKKCSVKTLRK